MEPIGTHGLACLGQDDWADYARYMQCQAEAIDAALFEQQTALESLLDRPTIIVRPSADRTFATATTVTDFYTTVQFNNSTFMTVSTSGGISQINIGSPVGGALIPYPRGLYLVGGFVNMDATGAVTAFSQRNLTINAVDATIQPPNQQIALSRDINPDSGAAGAITGIRECASFEIVLRGTNGVRITHALSHTNAASTVTAFQASAYLWVTYLGPDNLVEVA